MSSKVERAERAHSEASTAYVVARDKERALAARLADLESQLAAANLDNCDGARFAELEGGRALTLRALAGATDETERAAGRLATAKADLGAINRTLRDAQAKLQRALDHGDEKGRKAAAAIVAALTTA